MECDTIQGSSLLRSQWDFSKNTGINPLDVSLHSSKKVWWICDKGHSYQAVVSKRNAGQGCPYCSGHKVMPGFNDLATLRPDLLLMWSEENSMQPCDVSPGSSKKALWMCEKNHTWESSIKNIAKGQRCPYCAGNKVLAGFNDLATTHPDISSQWNWIKNQGESPSTVSAGSKKKVWWNCEKGHVFESRIDSRTRQRSGCPYCAGRKKWNQSPSVSKMYPEVASQWSEKMLITRKTCLTTARKASGGYVIQVIHIELQ